jgi:ankyrin repeat protein
MSFPTDSAKPTSQVEKDFVHAVQQNDVTRTRQLLTEHPALAKQLDQCWFAFDSPALVFAKHNLEMVRTLVQAGADINARSKWWAGGFGILDGVTTEQANSLIELGAKLDIHSAAALGMLDEVNRFLELDPQCVNARGGDGQTPLHFASTTAIIDRLIEAGADLESRDLDHSATAAQYHIDNDALCRHLLDRGAVPDIFMACALGDNALVSQLIKQTPGCVESRVGDCAHTKPIHEKASNHIYFWKLRQAQLPAEVAIEFGHAEIFDLLYQHSSPAKRLIASCWKADIDAAKNVIAENPDVISLLDERDKKDLARAAWTGKTDVVKTMLECGFDPHVVGDENSSPLDRAAFHGYADIVKLLLQYDPDPPLEQKNVYGGTPLTACIFGSIHSWIKNSNHIETARALIDAGAHFDLDWIPTVNPQMDQLLMEIANQKK